MSELTYLQIDEIMGIVRQGGAFKTGVDIYTDRGELVLEKDSLINRFSSLFRLKKIGITKIPFDFKGEGCLWNGEGEKIDIHSMHGSDGAAKRNMPFSTVEDQIAKIREWKEQVFQIQNKAKDRMSTLSSEIKAGDGMFDIQPLLEVIKDILYLIEKTEIAFSYQTHEIHSHEDYLINHTIEVCTLGAVILKKFNDHFGMVVNTHLDGLMKTDHTNPFQSAFVCYQSNEMLEIILGYLLHDIGMFIIPKSIFTKSEALTSEEYELIKSHSYQQGPMLLKKNGILSAVLHNILCYHHAPLYPDEERSYPNDKSPIELPAYAKICKLSDIFSAMTAKRAYQEAVNPVSGVTEIVRKYSNKDPFFQLILAAFVKVVGIYPPGSVVHLINGQQAYILDSNGPIIIPITDSFGNPIQSKPDPINIALLGSPRSAMNIDRLKPLLSPLEYHKNLPDYLK